MRRFQTVIAINLETRPTPCQVTVRADVEDSSLKNRFVINSTRSEEQFRLPNTLDLSPALRFSENRTPKTFNRQALATSFSQESTRPTATTGLLEQRHFETLRLHGLAQPGTLPAPPRSAKPRSHSDRREVKAVVVWRFQQLVHSEGFSRQDRERFPRWIKRYSEFVGKDGRENLPLTRDLAIGFSRMRLARQTPAWQRQQALKTLAVYRDVILETDEPLMTDVIRKLGQLAEHERGFGAAGNPDSRDVATLVGQIDVSASLVLQ